MKKKPVQIPDHIMAARVRRARAEGMRYLPSLRGNASGTPEERITRVMSIFAEKASGLKTDEVLFWVCYDISNNRIRRYLAKYLKQKGCIRVQRSVFLGRLKRSRYRELCVTLKEVHELYEHHDSILIMPVSRDMMDKTRFLGAQAHIDWIIAPKGMLWF
jgi:CRISPR-associated protein Cas2